VNHAPQTVEINNLDIPTSNPAPIEWEASVEVERLDEAADAAAEAAEVPKVQS
jgi:hypothetical protein